MNNSLSSPLISGLIAGIKHRERRTNNNQCLSNSFLKIGQFEFLYKTITRFYYKKNEVVYREEDKRDRRNTFYGITKEGLEVFDEQVMKFVDVIDEKIDKSNFY